MIPRNRLQSTTATLLLLALLSCAPAGFLLQPVRPSLNGRIADEYKSLSADEFEALFVRPFTERKLLDTSGQSSAMLYDYAYFKKKLEGVSGGEEALESMKSRYIDEGISFQAIVWGRFRDDVELSRFHFRLELKDGRSLEPIVFEPVGGAVADRRPVDGVATWHSTVDLTFPIDLAPPLSRAVLLVERDDLEVVDRHMWKFAWDD